MSLVGKKAPSFVAKAVVNGNEIVDEFSLDQYKGKKSVVFFPVYKQVDVMQLICCILCHLNDTLHHHTHQI